VSGNTENKLVVFNDDQLSIEVKVSPEEDTVWLTQAQIAELFDTTPQNITLHIRNVFQEEELEQRSTCKDFLQVQIEGGRSIKRKIKHYNLDVIIESPPIFPSVGIPCPANPAGPDTPAIEGGMAPSPTILISLVFISICWRSP
jgi:hypothetical protein